jgi:hypothetical protein
MFYIGFHDVNFAQIGIARSKDGITTGKGIRATRSSSLAKVGMQALVTNLLPFWTMIPGICGTMADMTILSKSALPRIRVRTLDLTKNRTYLKYEIWRYFSFNIEPGGIFAY